MSHSITPSGRVATSHNPAVRRLSKRVGFTSTRTLLLVLALIFALLVAACGPDRLVGFQGYLTNASGTPLSGTHNITFRLFSNVNSCNGGAAPVWEETQNNVQVTNGLFNVALGDVSAFANSNGEIGLKGIDPSILAQPLWLEIEIDGEVLTPCQPLRGAPYAMSLAGGAVVGSMHEGNGAAGTGDDTDEDFGSLSVVASGTNGTALVIGVMGTGDLVRACSGVVNARDCTDLEFRVTSVGEVYADGNFHAGGADFAEWIRAASSKVRYQPGDVLAISPEVDRAVVLADQPYSTAVIGVVSTKPGFLARPAGVEIESIESADGGMLPVAIVGIVPVKVTAENGAIHRGDLLTTSSKPGYAMKATRSIPGTILGKAMGELLNGEGVIEVFLMLR